MVVSTLYDTRPSSINTPQQERRYGEMRLIDTALATEVTAWLIKYCAEHFSIRREQ
jgi:hypothetical protein